jgi:RNA polymerase sigma-70 factor (ECF subfamily)
MSDPLQFEAFVRDYQNMVFATAYRLLADEMEAQDIAQEVFLKAYECFDELRFSPAAGGWLKTVTRNLCLNHLTRHRSRWRLFSELAGKREDDSDLGSLDEQFIAPETGYPDLETADNRALLAGAMERLPASQRVPLVLHYLEDMSYEAIAQSLNISLAKVKIDIHRGRLALRRSLSRNQNAGTIAL